MKKILTFIIFLSLMLSVSACKSLDKQSNDGSSQLNSENSLTLVRALIGSEDISLIESLSILNEYSPEETKITDSKDWSFLEKYVYCDTVSAASKDKLTDSAETNLIKIGVSEQKIYLLKLVKNVILNSGKSLPLCGNFNASRWRGKAVTEDSFLSLGHGFAKFNSLVRGNRNTTI